MLMTRDNHSRKKSADNSFSRACFIEEDVNEVQHMPIQAVIRMLSFALDTRISFIFILLSNTLLLLLHFFLTFNHAFSDTSSEY
jgi:hypothetical protein